MNGSVLSCVVFAQHMGGSNSATDWLGRIHILTQMADVVSEHAAGVGIRLWVS